MTVQSGFETYQAPPVSLEAEQSFLGSILIDNQAFIDTESQVRETDFYKESHRLIYKACGSLVNRGEPIELVGLTDELRKRGQIERVGGVPYLIGLMDNTPTAAYANSYADILTEKSKLRYFIDLAGKMVQDAHDGNLSLDDVLGRADQGLTRLMRNLRSGTTDSEAVDSALAYLEGTAKVKTGFTTLDEATGGLVIGDLTTLGARSTVGKSSLIYQIALEAISNTGQKVGILSPDQEKGGVVSVLAARLAQVSLTRLEAGQATPEQRRDYAAAVAYVKQHILPKLIVKDSSLGHDQIETECNRLVREGCGMIILDSLQALRDTKGDTRKVQIDSACLALKAVARDYRIPVVAISQIKQERDYDKDKRPGDYDLSDSKNIYDLSQTVLLMYRESLNAGMQQGVNSGMISETVEVRVAKQKIGRKNTVARLQYIPELSLFKNRGGITPGVSLRGVPFERSRA